MNIKNKVSSGINFFLSSHGKILNGKNVISLWKLSQLRNKYKGKRCFIIGNGPSLKKTDLSLLKNEYTFGLNRIYLLFKELNFETTFWVCVNQLIIDQCHQEINQLNPLKFISWQARKSITFDPKTILIQTKSETAFSKEPIDGFWEGSTVTYVAMQLAYYLGFKQVILIGVDHNFKTKGKPHKIIKQEENDPNHFSPEYFKGMKWQLPDLVTSEMAYQIAKYEFEQDGREIIDATIGGKLNVFKKVKYESLFKKNKKK